MFSFFLLNFKGVLVFLLFFSFLAKVKVFTVATDRTDGFLRYMRSARVYDIEVSLFIFFFFSKKEHNKHDNIL